MWEDERKKTIVRNVIIGILLVVLVCGFAVAFLQVRKQIAEEDRKLSDIKASQQQEQNDARQENLAAIQKAYENDMDTVAQYMPGIVCWGDSLTSGSAGNAAYPYTLQKYINTYLCDIYDFRYSVPNAEEYTLSLLSRSDFKVSIPVVNMGAGQENTATVLGRAGVAPYVVGADFTIPAGMERVPISITAPDGGVVTPLTAGTAEMNPVTIAGVEGTLTLETNGKVYSYFFERLTQGAAVSVTAGTEITTACASEYQNYIHIVWLGTYDGYRKTSDLVNDVKLLLQRQTQNTDRFLVLGMCTYNGSWSTNGTANLEDIDAAMLQAFGNRYINVRKYLIEDGLSDAGLTPTKEDSTDMLRGLVPHSFRSNARSADLNGQAYTLIGKLIYERMNRLGYFEEIRSELGIDKATEEILKSNPGYFESMLQTG